MVYQEKRGGFWKFIIIMLVIFLVVGGVTWYLKFWDTNMIKNEFNKIFVKKEKEQLLLIDPPKEVESWCQLQEMPTTSDLMKPISQRIRGYDSINSCCVVSIFGYNCALNRTSTLEYCFTGNVGGEIVWVIIDGYYVNNLLREDYINDYWKQDLGGCCKTNIYPDTLVDVVRTCERVEVE